MVTPEASLISNVEGSMSPLPQGCKVVSHPPFPCGRSAGYITNLHEHQKAWRIYIGMRGRFAIGIGGGFDRNTPPRIAYGTSNSQVLKRCILSGPSIRLIPQINPDSQFFRGPFWHSPSALGLLCYRGKASQEATSAPRLLPLARKIAASIFPDVAFCSWRSRA